MEAALKLQQWVHALERKDWGINGAELCFGNRGGKKVTLSFMTPLHTG